MQNPTRERLLGAAQTLFRRGGIEAVTMVDVARTAEVSRQAAYLHFADRGDLLVALIDRIDKEMGLETWYATVREAPTAAKAIEAWAVMQTQRNPHIAALARTLDTTRHGDNASAAAWRNRMQNRLLGARGIVDRLASEEKLHPSWTREKAALLLAELVSLRVWDDLVCDAAVDPSDYVAMITSTALSTLQNPLRKAKPAR